MVGSFWWRSVLKLLPAFKQFAICKAGRGDTTLFWTDIWLDQPLLQKFPELYSFTNNKEVSLQRVQALPEIEHLFHRPLSQEAFHQFTIFQTSLVDMPLPNVQDQWTYPWAAKQYSSMNMYNLLIGASSPHNIFEQLWDTSCGLRHKIFLWPLLHDRTNTRNLLNRKNMYMENYNCALCSKNTEETTMHLFWDCPFALHWRGLFFHLSTWVFPPMTKFILPFLNCQRNLH